MKFNFKIQQYQTDAVVKVFSGQGRHDRVRYIRDFEDKSGIFRVCKRCVKGKHQQAID